MTRIAKEVRVTGRVQGVGFRAWTAAMARGLGLAGWVRNEADGSVRAHLAGSEAAVADMLARLAQGPSHARVDRVEAVEVSDAPLAGFEVRR